MTSRSRLSRPLSLRCALKPSGSNIAQNTSPLEMGKGLLRLCFAAHQWKWTAHSNTHPPALEHCAMGTRRRYGAIFDENGHFPPFPPSQLTCIFVRDIVPASCQNGGQR